MQTEAECSYEIQLGVDLQYLWHLPHLPLERMLPVHAGYHHGLSTQQLGHTGGPSGKICEIWSILYYSSANISMRIQYLRVLIQNMGLHIKLHHRNYTSNIPLHFSLIVPKL